MIQELFNEFMSSPHGAAAMQELQGTHGLSAADAESALNAATHGAVEGLAGEGGASAPSLGGLLGSLGGSGAGNAITGALSSMLHGGGLKAAMEGGVEGAIGGKIAEAVAKRTGIDPNVARTAAAAITPYVVRFIEERMNKKA